MSATQAQTLPSEFAAVLRRLRHDHVQLDAVLRVAHRRGWSQTVLAAELGVSRQNVGQRIVRASYGPPTTVEVPKP